MSDDMSGVPPEMREHIRRFAAGCIVCGSMNWYAKGANEQGAIYECGDCGNVFGVPLAEERSHDNA